MRQRRYAFSKNLSVFNTPLPSKFWLRLDSNKVVLKKRVGKCKINDVYVIRLEREQREENSS